MTLALRPYQEVGRDFLAGRRHALLADGMRVGKTPQAILAATKLNLQKVLVVCPAIARQQWLYEWHRWYEAHGVRLKQPMLEIYSFDQARRSAEVLKKGHWDLLIVDEAHFAKNPEAERTKLIYGKDGLGWRADRLWALSGTPAPKHAGELWAMLRAFGAVGMTYSEFIYRYCTFNRWTKKIVGTNVDRIPELKAILSKVMLRRTLAEVAPELPAIDFQFLNVDLLEKVDLPDREIDDSVNENTFDADDRQAVAMAKVLPLVEQICFAIENGLLKQTVVFGWHTAPLIALVDALMARGIAASALTGKTGTTARGLVQAGFKTGHCQVVCANILAAGTAIDLSAASHGFFIELDWVPGNNVQAANRLVSMDKKAPVSFDIVTVPGSIDSRVQKVLLTRTQQLAKIYS